MAVNDKNDEKKATQFSNNKILRQYIAFTSL